jgi:hypothetical protein
MSCIALLLNCDEIMERPIFVSHHLRNSAIFVGRTRSQRQIPTDSAVNSELLFPTINGKIG